MHVQGALYRELVRRHGVTAIAAEAASFNPRRFVMAVGLCMSIGALTGVAAALGLELYELPPKRWQGAILGRAAGAKGKIDYAEVERRLAEFIGRDDAAAEQLAAIPAGQRNHALDAVGVGVFVALRPEARSSSRSTAQALARVERRRGPVAIRDDRARPARAAARRPDPRR